MTLLDHARAQERDDAAASHEKDAKHGLLVQKKPPQYPQDGLKFAIAGTGAMGLEHIRNISLLRERGSTIVAVADSDARARKEARAELDKWGFPNAKVMSDWHSLFDCGCDAFIVATPNYQHHELLVELLPLAKMHVLCEKPLCTTIQDCLDVEKLVKEHYTDTEFMFMVGMEYRPVWTSKFKRPSIRGLSWSEWGAARSTRSSVSLGGRVRVWAETRAAVPR